jgi:hypothetical protein
VRSAVTVHRVSALTLLVIAGCTAGTSTTATVRSGPTATVETVPATSIAATPAPTAAARPRQTADQPDDHDGYQIHYLYVLPSDGIDEQLDTNGWMATAVGSMLRWFEKASGGRRLSVDTFRGELDITFVRLGRTDAVVSAYDSRSPTSREPLVRVTLEVELRSLGFDHPKKVYAAWYGGGSDSGECFGGSYPPSRVGNIGVANLKHPRCQEARNMVFPDGAHAIAVLNLHEIFHTLGAVGRCAPHHDAQSAGHVNDDAQDIMAARGARTGDRRFDAGRDDYFGHGRPDCLDLARSPFLLPVPANPELPPLWPLGVARARDCAEEATIGRSPSTTQSGVVIDNMTDSPLQVFALGAQGRTLRDTARPWTASYQRFVQAGTAWLVADANGKCIAVYVAETSWTRASVRTK